MKHFTTGDFDATALDPQSVAVVGFVAGWCRPSMLQAALLEKLAADYDGKATIGTVDVDADEALADRFEVRTLPGVLLFARGELIEALPGYQPEDFLRACIEQLLQPPEV